MTLRRFNSCLFTLGLVFLFNPVIGLVDILPDFIGALCIAAAVTEVAMLDERLENARRLMYYLAAVSGVRTVLMLFTFDMNDNDVLSAVTILAVCELFVLIYFAVSFFGGISYIAQRSESEGVLGAVDRIRRLWIVFFCLHSAATVVPELAALPQLLLLYDPESIPWLTEGRLQLYKNYLILILGTAAFALGVWWLKQTYAFIKDVRGDKDFTASLEKRYGQFLAANPLQGLFLDVRFAAICFVLGCALQVGIRVDGMDVLPAWVGTLLLLLAVWRLNKKSNVTALVYLCVAAAIQGVAVHLLGGIPSAVLLAVTGVAAVYLAEQGLATRVKAAIDWDISGYYLFTRVLYGGFFVLSAVYSGVSNYWIHLGRILCYGGWIAVAVWFCSSVTGEIKLRRRL